MQHWEMFEYKRSEYNFPPTIVKLYLVHDLLLEILCSPHIYTKYVRIPFVHHIALYLVFNSWQFDLRFSLNSASADILVGSCYSYRLIPLYLTSFIHVRMKNIAPPLKF